MLKTTFRSQTTGSVQRADAMLEVNDSVNTSFAEECVYQVLDWTDESVNLERISCSSQFTAGGGGSLTFPPAAYEGLQPPPKSWSYSAKPPTSFATSVSLDPASGTGTFDPGPGGTVRARSADGEEGEEGLASIPIFAAMTGASGVSLPAGVEFSGGRLLGDVLQFRFPGRAGQFSGGDQGSYHVRWTEAAGAFEATVTLSYNVAWGPPSPHEVRLEVDGYEGWVPEGNLEVPGEAGNDLSVHAAVYDARTGRRSAAKVNLLFTLQDVSREPGVCTNWRETEDEPGSDLKLLQDRNGDLEVFTEREARTKEPTDEASVVVTSFDFGAHGLLAVTATDRDGRQVPVGFRTRRNAPVAVPLDDDGNFIADGWDKEHGSSGQGPEWDEDDRPQGQRRDGDGFTAYEEYRGFWTKDGYVRTEPRRKDLFAYDPDGLVRQYFASDNPGELTLHFVEPPMIRFTGVARDPDNRWVNFNSNDMYARQYALYVKSWPIMTDEEDSSWVVGEASDSVLSERLAGYSPQSFEQPLKCFYLVKVSPAASQAAVGSVQDPATKQVLYNKLMVANVIHEMGHALGVRHHAQDGGETDASTTSGVVECAMRYTSKIELEHPDHLPWQKKYCRQGDSYRTPTEGKDKDGTSTYGWDIHPAHDCFGQIDVKSDPGPCPGTE